jgi:hypothetical protein
MKKGSTGIALGKLNAVGVSLALLPAGLTVRKKDAVSDSRLH